MRTVDLGILLILGLGAAGAAGWWAWREHRARPSVLPPSGDFGFVPDSLEGAASPPEPRPSSGVVDGLPRGSGRTQGSRRTARTRTGIARALNAEGSIRWMTGAQSIGFDVDAGLAVTVSASVERGGFRVYLRDGERYRWAEATPGAPLEIRGHLITGTFTYLFFAEAVGGRAEGIRWRVTS